MKNNTIHLYIFTLCRYFMATMILAYAFSKILGTQFVSQPSIFDRPIGTLNGFQLTWYYYSFSYWYSMVIAFTQILSAALLFFRKTTRIGVVLFLTFMVNILLVDFAYNIEGAKGMAIILTLMGLFVFFSEFPLHYKYLLKEPPLFAEYERPNWLNKIKRLKWPYIIFISGFLFFGLIYLKNKIMGQNKFYGSWRNIENKNFCNRLYFEAANTFILNKSCNQRTIVQGNYYFNKDYLVLKIIPDNNKESDTAKMVTLLKGIYKIEKNKLTIKIGGNDKMSFEKVR